VIFAGFGFLMSSEDRLDSVGLLLLIPQRRDRFFWSVLFSSKVNLPSTICSVDPLAPLVGMLWIPPLRSSLVGVTGALARGVVLAPSHSY